MTYKQAIDEIVSFLSDKWGLNEQFARLVAPLFLYLNSYHIQWRINSGFRSVKEQEELYRAWLKGTPGIYTPALPGKSLHNNVNWIGQPSSLAIDIWTSNPQGAGWIASKIGLRWMGMRDPVHFQQAA